MLLQYLEFLKTEMIIFSINTLQQQKKWQVFWTEASTKSYAYNICLKNKVILCTSIFALY
jgi:hypothetical protein